MKILFCLLTGSLMVLPVISYAQPNNDPIASAEPEPVRKEIDTDGVFTVSWENDMFYDEDNDYTNGVRFSYFSPENSVPDWIEEAASAMPLFSTKGHKRWSFAIGQNMYTPSDISVPTLQLNDRPYAGWTYGTIGLMSDLGNRLDNLQLTVGMVGPASKAEETQKAVHRIVDSQKPMGWDNQLRDELGVVLSYNRKWRGLYEFSPFGFGMDITPSLGGNVGNVFTNATAGTVVRFGYDLPSDYGPPLIQPTLAGSEFFVPTKSFGWYLFAGVEGRAVARNIFLDGNTFRDSHSVDKKELVGDFQGGIAFTFNTVRVAYTHIVRTKEFDGQEKGDQYGAITVSARF
jgi:lipid A 3-O-deacylase